MAAENCFVNVSHLYTQQINIIHMYFSTTAIAYTNHIKAIHSN